METIQTSNINITSSTGFKLSTTDITDIDTTDTPSTTDLEIKNNDNNRISEETEEIIDNLSVTAQIVLLFTIGFGCLIVIIAYFKFNKYGSMFVFLQQTGDFWTGISLYNKINNYK